MSEDKQEKFLGEAVVTAIFTLIAARLWSEVCCMVLSRHYPGNVWAYVIGATLATILAITILRLVLVSTSWWSRLGLAAPKKT